MASSKEPPLLSDCEWDVGVKKKPVVCKKWLRCTLFSFVTLVVLALVLLFMCGFVYRHDFLGFVKLKPFVELVSYAPVKERLHSGAIRMVAEWSKREIRNTVWSPLTVSLCLGLLLEGTTDQTANEIKSAMRWIGINREHIRSHASRVITRLNGMRSLDMVIANRIFLHSSYDVTPKYRSILEDNYGASVDHVDFGNTGALEKINKWGSEASRGQIRELLPSGSVDPATKMVLSTILTFSGKWKSPFSPNYTQEAKFTSESGKTSRVDMMYQTGRFLHAEFPGHEFAALELPYTEPNVSMIVILPRNLSRLKKLLSEQEGKILNNVRSKMNRVNVDICLPKFTIETGNSIEGKLSSLGIQRLFDPSLANLDLMSPDHELYVRKIIHRVKIQINEGGTSGQASSSSILEGRSLAFSFCADRPFLFYVEDTETKSFLFWGEYHGRE